MLPFNQPARCSSRHPSTSAWPACAVLPPPLPSHPGAALVPIHHTQPGALTHCPTGPACAAGPCLRALAAGWPRECPCQPGRCSSGAEEQRFEFVPPEQPSNQEEGKGDGGRRPPAKVAGRLGRDQPRRLPPRSHDRHPVGPAGDVRPAWEAGVGRRAPAPARFDERPAVAVGVDGAPQRQQRGPCGSKQCMVHVRG